MTNEKNDARTATDATASASRRAAASGRPAAVTVRGARKAFGSKEVLRDVSLTIHEGEILSLIGPSGAGKSTMLRCMTLLDRFDSADFSYGDLEVCTPERGYLPQAVREARMRFGIVFQNYNLFNLKDIHYIGFDNFVSVIKSTSISFTQVLWNTLLWVVFSLIFQFLLGFLLAMMLRKPFTGRSIYCGFVFYTWALCGFAIGLIWSWLFNGQFGIINDLLMKAGIIKSNIGWLSEPRWAMVSVVITNVWYGVPYFGIMLLAALQSVPKELYEAATIDGCGSVQQLFSVTIPYIKPTIVSTVLLRTMWIMNFPDIIYAMTQGGPINSTNILATSMVTKVFTEYDYGQGSAIGVIIMVILFTYSIIYLKVMKKSEDDV